MSETRKVVVTGMGVCAPKAIGVESMSSLLKSGQSAIEFIPELEEFGFKCQIGGIARITDNPYAATFDHYDLETASDFVQLACYAGMEAWEMAGLPYGKDLPVDWETGAIVGTGVGGIDTIGKKCVQLTDHKRVRRLGGTTTQNIMPSGASAYLSDILGLGNKSSGLSSACCTGTEAIIEGYYRIKNGLADRMIVGGSEGYSKYFWAGFDAMLVMNRYKNDDPQAGSRPMSLSSRGFIPASGAGVLVIESLEQAKERGATIIAEIKGGYSNCGGFRDGGSMTFPNKEGVHKCLTKTFEMAGIAPSEIDLINGHLTGTKADTNEITSWSRFYQDSPFPLINASKSIYGHTLGASGGVEIITTLLQMRDSFVHANLNSEDMIPEIADLIGTDSSHTEVRMNQQIKCAIKASFGFGDINSSIIFKEFDQ